jgi:hypothetical protein
MKFVTERPLTDPDTAARKLGGRPEAEERPMNRNGPRPQTKPRGCGIGWMRPTSAFSRQFYRSDVISLLRPS